MRTMHSKRLILLQLLLFGIISCSDTDQNTRTKEQHDIAYDQIKKADNPDQYLKLNEELRTKSGDSRPAYPVGYRQKELEKANNASRSLRLSESYEFIERGPGNVPGRTRGLVIDPDDNTHRTWYAGGVGGGIWKTTDGGQNWVNKSPDIPNLSISWIVMAESNRDVMYAGTGEGWGRNFSFIKGNGIIKSTDRGETWVPLASTTENPDFEIVNRLVVDPANENIVLAATSTDLRYNPTQGSGIFKSIDGGISWQQKHQSQSYVHQIVADPSDFNILYAAIDEVGVIKSLDAGETWSDFSNGLSPSGRIEIAVSPVNPSRLYASVQGDLSGTGSDLYFTSDAAATWDITINQDGENIDFLGGQGWYDNTILAHPFELDEVYVGGVNLWKFEVSSATENLGKRFAGAEEIDIESFFSLNPFNSGVYYNSKIAIGEEAPEDFVSVEIRFGPDGEGGILQQKAHRFTVPDGRGSGVAPNEYSYEDYVDVPFQIWDIENNRQLMVSFRDQQKDIIFNLLTFNAENSSWETNSREYLFISNVTYDETAPDPNIALDGGHEFRNLFFLWPFLPETGVWEPENFPTSLFRIRYEEVIGKGATITSIADAYGQYGGNNSFSQTTGSTVAIGVHPDHHNIVPIIHDPINKTFQLVIANDGGLYSSNIAANPGIFDGAWTYAGNGYNTSQFYAVDKAPGESRYAGGLQDNGTWMSSPNSEGSATARYRRVNGGDGFGTAWNYRDKNLLLSTIYNNRIEKSTNEGASSAQSTSGLDDVGAGFGPFVTELENIHSDPDVVFTAGISGIWRSDDFADSWSLAPITQQWGLYSTMLVRISQANSHFVWAGASMTTTSNLALHISTDEGKSFNPVSIYEKDLGRLSGLATHPTLDSTAFALFSFAKNPKIVRTDDLGETWHDISGFENDISSRGFPDVAVRDLIVMPYDTAIMWAGTEIGIFESLDAGANWHPLPGSLPAVPVMDMKIVDQEVVLGTHGRGIWSVEIAELDEHVYLPTIISATPSLNDNLTLDVRFEDDFDSTIVYVDGVRSARYEANSERGILKLSTEFSASNAGIAHVRSYRKGRPFVSHRFEFNLFEFADVVDSYENDFEGSNEDFSGNGFSIRFFDSFTGQAIHSNHNYEQNTTYQFILKSPIRVKSTNAYINFDEVVLVERGETGAMPGSDEFKDFVVVQGSLDGVNWINLIDEYDSNNKQLWKANFSPIVPGSKDLFLFRAINILDTFNEGDEILIRFLLSSDLDINGWGWAIDNLKIQTESVIASISEAVPFPAYQIYPNPVATNSFNVIGLKGTPVNQLNLYSSSGKFELSIPINGEIKDEISLPPNLKNGLYFIVIEEPNRSLTYKLIIDR